MLSSTGQNTHPGLTLGGEIKAEESEPDQMQGLERSLAGVKQEDDGNVKAEDYTQISSDDSDPRIAGSSAEEASKLIFVEYKPGESQTPGAEALSPASDESEESGNDDKMEEGEERSDGDAKSDFVHTCGHVHVCSHVDDSEFCSDEWGNDLLKRLFHPSFNDIRRGLLDKAELNQVSDSKSGGHPGASVAEITSVGELSLGEVFPMPFTLNSTQRNAMKAIGLHHYVGTASLDITVDGQPEPDGTEVTLFKPVEVFQAITKLGRPDRHTPTHQMWCSEDLAARNWNERFNEDRLRGMEDVLEWDVPGTYAGVVIEDEESGDSVDMSMINLKLVLRARSDRGFVAPWDL